MVTNYKKKKQIKVNVNVSKLTRLKKNLLKEKNIKVVLTLEWDCYY